MAENPISHVVSVLKGAIEQIERSQSTVSTSSFVSTSSSSHVSKSSQVSIPALPVSTVSRPLIACVCNESFGQAALRNFRFVILVIALNTFNIFSTPDQCRVSE